MARPRKTVRADDGQEVYGLSFTHDRKSDKDRYYLTGTRPPVWLGYDRNEAIRRFYALRARETREQVAVGPGSEFLERFVERVRSGEAKPSIIAPMIAGDLLDGGAKLVDADQFYERMRDAIARDPKGCAKRTGIPELGYLQKLDKPKPSLRFKQAIDLYLSRPTKRITRGEQSKLTAHWLEFAEAVGVARIEDVTTEAVEAWAARISESYLSGTGSPKSVLNKITKVRTILRYASEKGHEDCTRVLRMVRAIDLPSARKVAPKPMSRGDFHTLLDAADAKWRAILLTAMNCCFYAADIRLMPKSVIDHETGEVVYPRPKTNVARVAMLWQRTRDALAEMPEHNLSAVFISGVRAPYSEGGFRKAYDRFKARAGVSATFAQIRDGAYTAAIRGGADITTVRMIAGHATGMSDAYVMRGGEMVKGACRAIEARYF